MKDGSARYHVADAEIAPGLHWLVFARNDATGSPKLDVAEVLPGGERAWSTR